MMPGAMTPLSISVFIKSMNYALPSLSVAFGVLPATSRNSYIDKVGMSVCNHAFLNVNVSVESRLTSSQVCLCLCMYMFVDKTVP